MIQFEPITIGLNTYQLSEITFNESLKVAVIDKKFNEKRITEFLSNTLVNVNPLKITAQERYLIMLKYMQKQNETLFSSDLDYSKYIHEGTEFSSELSENGITVRQLFGRDAEYLESNCNNAAEWNACMMAMQLSYAGHEVLERLPDQNAIDHIYTQVFLHRLEYIKNRAASDFEQLYADFSGLNDRLFSRVSLIVSNEGLVLRGADDAPLRFCASYCFRGIIKELDRSFT